MINLEGKQLEGYPSLLVGAAGAGLSGLSQSPHRIVVIAFFAALYEL